MSIRINQPMDLFTYEELDDNGRARAYSDLVEWDFAGTYHALLEDTLRQAFPDSNEGLQWAYELEGRGRGFTLYGRFALDDFAPMLCECGLWSSDFEGLTFETGPGDRYTSDKAMFSHALADLGVRALTGDAIRACLAYLAMVCRDCFKTGTDLLEAFWAPEYYDCMLFRASGEFWGHTWDVVDGQAC